VAGDSIAASRGTGLVAQAFPLSAGILAGVADRSFPGGILMHRNVAGDYYD
jgi:hypothetical protein